MKKFGFAAVIAGGLLAGGIGAPAAQAAFATPAGVDHRVRIDQVAPQVSVPHVDTIVDRSH